MMRSVHTKLRHRFLHDIASYIAVLVDRDNGQAWCLFCGDCRLGMKTDKVDGIRWITNVHTVANATGELLALTESTNPARHTLTRSLNAKRFAAPDVIDLDPLSHGQSWILCSDGFWAEHLGNDIPLGQQSDDASYLEISQTLPAGLQRTDCCNYSVHTQGSPKPGTLWILPGTAGAQNREKPLATDSKSGLTLVDPRLTFLQKDSQKQLLTGSTRAHSSLGKRSTWLTRLVDSQVGFFRLLFNGQ